MIVTRFSSPLTLSRYITKTGTLQELAHCFRIHFVWIIMMCHIVHMSCMFHCLWVSFLSVPLLLLSRGWTFHFRPQSSFFSPSHKIVSLDGRVTVPPYYECSIKYQSERKRVWLKNRSRHWGSESSGGEVNVTLDSRVFKSYDNVNFRTWNLNSILCDKNPGGYL